MYRTVNTGSRILPVGQLKLYGVRYGEVPCTSRMTVTVTINDDTALYFKLVSHTSDSEPELLLMES